MTGIRKASGSRICPLRIEANIDEDPDFRHVELRVWIGCLASFCSASTTATVCRLFRLCGSIQTAIVSLSDATSLNGATKAPLVR